MTIQIKEPDKRNLCSVIFFRSCSYGGHLEDTSEVLCQRWGCWYGQSYADSK